MKQLGPTVAITQLFLRRFFLHPMIRPLNFAGIFVLPIVIALIFGYADEQARTRLPVGVFGAETSAVSQQLFEVLDAEPGVAVKSFDDRDTLVGAIERGEVVGGVAVVDDGQQIQVIADDDDPLHQAAALVTTSVAWRVLLDGNGDDIEIEIDDSITGQGAELAGYPRASAGMLVFWVFMNATLAALLMAEDFRQGVFYRLSATPLRPGALVVGEVGGRILVAFVQAMIIAAISRLVFGLSWGAVGPFIAIVLAIAAASAAVSVILGVTLRGPAAVGFAAVTALAAVLGLLGGSFWSVQDVPAIMRTLSFATPHGWALDAFEELASRGGGFADISAQFFVLLGLAVTLTGFAVLRLRALTSEVPA